MHGLANAIGRWQCQTARVRVRGPPTRGMNRNLPLCRSLIGHHSRRSRRPRGCVQAQLLPNRSQCDRTSPCVAGHFIRPARSRTTQLVLRDDWQRSSNRNGAADENQRDGEVRCRGFVNRLLHLLLPGQHRRHSTRPSMRSQPALAKSADLALQGRRPMASISDSEIADNSNRIATSVGSKVFACLRNSLAGSARPRSHAAEYR